MKEYLLLQYYMTNRKLRDAGILPMVAYLLIALTFSILSYYLFQQSIYAHYIYTLLALAFLYPLSETKRCEFLNICFGDKLYKSIRMVENAILVLPFTVVLFLNSQYILAAVLLSLALLMAFNTYNTILQFTIPTPFGSKPYEFALGFRNTFYVCVITYCLAVVSVIVGNFNLGVFALLLLFAVTLGYYSTPEPEYYVWQHSHTPKGFLLMKYSTAIKQATLLTLPVLLILCIAYYSNIQYILMFQLLGYIYLGTNIAAKYAVYPNQMNIPQGIILALGFCFPPALIIVLPYFISRAMSRLQPLLK